MHNRLTTRSSKVVLALFLTLAVGACSKKQPPVARPVPPPPPATESTTSARPPAPPEPVVEPTPVVPADPDLNRDTLADKSLDDLNRTSPLQAVFYDYDSSELNGAGQMALSENAQVMKNYASWVITIEGHCDERGSAEYNLALGERRALSARNYLVSLGISGDRLRTVSYGKEFPFDPGHTEDAWAKNRRAHFVITAK